MKKKNNKYDNALIVIVLAVIALGYFIPAQSWEYDNTKCTVSSTQKAICK